MRKKAREAFGTGRWLLEMWSSPEGVQGKLGEWSSFFDLTKTVRWDFGRRAKPYRNSRGLDYALSSSCTMV